MDILNIISWIKSSRLVTTVDPDQTLVPVGLKDIRRSDGYLAGVISVTDLLELVPPLSGPNYIFIEGTGTPLENGSNLVTAYNNAISATPNGLPLSDDNRYTILLAPGVYQVTSTIQWNTDFIDLACIDGVATLTRSTFNVPIIVSANDTRFSNIKLAFLFLESVSYIGWPILNNKSKVLLNNCSGYFESSNYSEEYTIDRDYLNTTVSRRILQNCLTPISIYLNLSYVDLDPNLPTKTQFSWSENKNLFLQSRFDLGAISDTVISVYTSPLIGFAAVSVSLPVSDKYILMNISNVVGTFSLNDVVTQGGTTGIITETDGGTYFIAYVATGVFPNGTGTITNTTSGGTADNNGWFQNGNGISNNSGTGLDLSGYNVNANVMSIGFVNFSGPVGYYSFLAIGTFQVSPQMYILYEGPNTSFDPGAGVSIIYNNLGGTADPTWSTNAGELFIQNLSGTWNGATQIWSDVNTTPVTITARSQNIIHTLNKTVTNR
jgi:hypothetical protein